jgi:hypothetical protein
LQAENRRLVVPQIVAGDAMFTRLQLDNPGSEPFDGRIVFYDSNAVLLPLKVNGEVTSGFSFFQIPATGHVDLVLTGTDPLVVGHAVISDNYPQNDFSFSPALQATVFFRSQAGEQQSIGVPIPPDMEHFQIPVEVIPANAVNTGIAVSNAFNFDNPLYGNGTSRATIFLRAISDSGETVAGTAFALDLNKHQAFLFDEMLSIPVPFRGSVEVWSDRSISVLALRLEGSHLSILPPQPVEATYDVHITLENNTHYQGEMVFSQAGGVLDGFFRFLGPEPYNPGSFFARLTQFRLVGSGREGIFRAMVSLEGDPNLVLILENNQTPIQTRNLSNEGRVVWTFADGPAKWGVFQATKRKAPPPDPGTNPCAVDCSNGLPPSVDAGPSSVTIVGGQALILNGKAMDPNLPPGVIPSFDVQWRIAAVTDGVDISLEGADSLQARLVTPEVTSPATVVLELEVTLASNGCSCSDQIEVILQP